MKRCTYCGKEHDDTATECVIDGQSLIKVFPSPQVQWRYQYPAVSPLRVIVGATIGAGVFGALLLLVMVLSLPLPLAMLAFVALAGYATWLVANAQRRRALADALELETLESGLRIRRAVRNRAL